MSVLSGTVIRRLCGADPKVRLEAAPMIEPFQERSVIRGRSVGCSIAGYDIQIAEDHKLAPGSSHRFELGSSVERFSMPRGVIGLVKDKSSWARQGLNVFNTVIEPGWCGYLTLELVYHGDGLLIIMAGDPIAQVIFHWVDVPGEGYSGKYQNQEAGPHTIRYEPDHPDMDLSDGHWREGRFYPR